MRFESRDFKLAKDAEHPDENQDAFGTDPRRGVAAIADGVASGIFARQWARILIEAVLADPPDPDDRPSFAAWLAARREAWQAAIDVSQLAWFQKPKLRDGAFSTLLWVEIAPLDEADRRAQDPWRLRARAVGDTCLFHFRGPELLRAFPIERSAELEADPVVIGSVDLNRDELLRFASYEALCRPGDLVVLCTDAVADWALRRHEAADPPDWEDYWDMPEAAWQEEVAALRRERHMRYDDATLVLLRVGDGVSAPAESARSTPAAEPAPAEPSAPPAGPASDPRSHPDWSQRLRSLSDQFSEQVARGMKKLQGARQSAESALRKYRDKLRPDDRDGPEP